MLEFHSETHQTFRKWPCKRSAQNCASSYLNWGFWAKGRFEEQGTESLTRKEAGLHGVAEWSSQGAHAPGMSATFVSGAGCPLIFICSLPNCYFCPKFGKSVRYTQESEQLFSGHTYVMFLSLKVVCTLSCSQMLQGVPCGPALVTAHCGHCPLHVALAPMTLTLDPGRQQIQTAGEAE